MTAIPKISIITPFKNGIDLLPDYIAATLGAELVLIDNGSDPETADALRELPPDRGVLIRNESNLGFAAANNQGYAAATGDVIIFLNSDIAGDPAWLGLVADDVQDGALYGPSVAQQLVYGMWVPYVEGWCVAATRATWERLRPDLEDWTAAKAQGAWESLQRQLAVEKVDGKRSIRQPGPWDAESYPKPYWEDNDLGLRALEQGISLTHTAWPVQHKGGRTAGALVKHGATFEQNRATFAARVKPVWERMHNVS